MPPCLGDHAAFYACLSCVAALHSNVAQDLAPDDQNALLAAAESLKRKLPNEFDVRAARNVELLDTILVNLKLDAAKKKQTQQTLDFAVAAK